MNKPLTDAETDARRVRLARIADRHLDLLGKLPLADRMTVVMTLCGSILMEVDQGQQLSVWRDISDGIRGFLLAEGIGA